MAKREKDASIKAMVDATEHMLKSVSSADYAKAMTTMLDRINKRCGVCSFGAFHGDGTRCGGKMHISHDICPKMRMDEIAKRKEDFVTVFKSKDAANIPVMNVKCGKFAIEKGTTLFKYDGEAMSSKEFERLKDGDPHDDARKRLSLKSKDGCLVVPLVVSHNITTKNYMPSPGNHGACIRVGTSETCNVEALQAKDKSFIVVTTKYIEAGEVLNYPPSEQESGSDSDSEEESDSASEEE